MKLPISQLAACIVQSPGDSEDGGKKREMSKIPKTIEKYFPLV